MVNAIEIEALVKSFGSVRALDGLTMAVPEGVAVALLGPNGAGKTTAMRVLTTVLRPDGGRATVAGLDVVTDASRLRHLIGVSGQFSAVDDNLTGHENLELVGRLHRLGKRASRRRAEELLDVFGLAGAGRRLLKTYSGGMRRRIDIACALVSRPQVLFLDEPTSGLDPRSRTALWDLLGEIVASGRTLLFTTQYLEEVDRLSDELIVIDHGHAVARGTPDELKDLMGDNCLELTVSDPADVEPARTALAPVAAGMIEVDLAARLITVPVLESVSALTEGLKRLEQSGVRVLRIGIRRPTLDEVFLTLTNPHKER